VVAAKPVTRGQPINADQVRAVSWPAALAPPGSFQDTEKATGRVALADLAPGEAVTETRLARVRAGPVASLIPEGLRAFAVPTSLPAGMVMPGDRVDVLATYGQGQSEARTETVLDAVEVLLALGAGQGRDGGLSSLDRGLDASAGQGRSVTLVLLVTSEQQERLAFASSFANLEVTIEPV
jgi:Flp pilus assembly protein CpaB